MPAEEEVFRLGAGREEVVMVDVDWRSVFLSGFEGLLERDGVLGVV